MKKPRRLRRPENLYAKTHEGLTYTISATIKNYITHISIGIDGFREYPIKKIEFYPEEVHLLAAWLTKASEWLKQNERKEK